MKDEQIKQLAAEIAALLFTTGAGRKAQRLVLVDENKRDLGGWGEKPIADLIEAKLRAVAGKKKAARK